MISLLCFNNYYILKYFPFTCKINKISPVQESEGKFMLKQGVACLKCSYVQPPNDSLLRFKDTFFNSYQNWYLLYLHLLYLPSKMFSNWSYEWNFSKVIRLDPVNKNNNHMW